MTAPVDRVTRPTTSGGLLSKATGSPLARTLLATGAARLAVLPVTGVASLLLARYLTGLVGLEVFGAVMLIATLSQLLMFADLGASAAVATASAETNGTTEAADNLRRVLLSGVRIVLCSAAVLSVASVLLGVLGAWPRILGITAVADGRGLANLATVLALLTFSLCLPLTLGEPLLRGSGHLHQAVLLTGLAAPTALVLAFVFHLFNAAPFAYALVIPLGAALSVLLTAIAAGRHSRGVVAGLAAQALRPRKFPGRPILATAAPWFVVMLGLPIALQTDRLVIAHRAPGIAGLADYSYATQLYGPLWSVVSVAALGLWPVFARRAEPGARRGAWLKAVGLLGTTGTAFAVGFLVLAGPVIVWVSDGASRPTFAFLASFALLLTVQSLHVGTGIMLIAPRQLRFQAICVVLLVLTNLPLSWFLAPVLGATGPVLASAITVAACQLVPGLVAGYRWTAESGSRGSQHPTTAPTTEPVSSEEAG